MVEQRGNAVDVDCYDPNSNGPEGCLGAYEK
jgi:hypothetical protein